MSDVNPADVVTAGSRVLSEEFPHEPSGEPESRKPEREGLPTGYRMRADAHYVDQLTSRRAERADRVLADSPKARRAEIAEPEMPGPEPRERRDLRERRTDRLLLQMAEELATIESSAAMLASDGSPTARRVGVDLVRSHAWRASFMIRAGAIVDGVFRGVVRPRPIGTILAAVRDGFAPECRLSTFGLHVHAADWNAAVSVDEPAVIAGITGAVIATLGLIGSPEGATIKISATVAAGELRALEVTQDEVGVAPGVAPRFFDPTWTDRPGGWTAALAAAAARAVAQNHGGEAAFSAAARRGTSIRLTFGRV